MEIDKTEFNSFLEEGLSQIRNSHDMHTKSFPCPECKTPVLFPIIARQQDINDFKRIIGIIKDYAADVGIQDKVINELLGRLHANIALQAFTRKGGF